VDPWDTTIAWHGYAYDAAGNREEKEYDAAESGNKYTYSNNNMNQLTTLTASGTPGHKTDVAGTVTDENVASVTVYNDTLESDFAAQLRETFFIARGVELDVGTNSLYAEALDKTGSETRDPEEGYHVVTLDDPPDPSLSYIYDDNGCLVEITEGATTLKEYIYDYENRLVEVKHGGAPVAAFEYDGLGRRVWSDVGGVETRFIYDGDAVVEEYAWDTQSSSWVLAAVYVHGIGIDNTLTIERDGNVYYYHYDGYGSVSELTDEDGALAQAYEYDAWGIATIYDPESAIENPYLYTGRRWDAAIGLYYYRARHYAPTLGRFLQPDPIGYGDGTNLYVYVRNAPSVFVDPTGMDPSDYDDELLEIARELRLATGAPDTYYAEQYFERRRSRDPFAVGVMAYYSETRRADVATAEMIRGSLAGQIALHTADFVENTRAGHIISGSVEFAGGLGVAGVGALLTDTGVGGVIGVPLMAWGWDHATNGSSMVFWDEPCRPVRDALVGGMEAAGVDRATAEWAHDFTETTFTIAGTALVVGPGLFRDPTTGSSDDMLGLVDDFDDFGQAGMGGAWGADDGLQVLQEHAGSNVPSSVSKVCPNPYGKGGGPRHQGVIGGVVRDIEARGLLADTEVPIKTVGAAAKETRVMDVVGRDPVSRRIVEVHQVGLTQESHPMVPIARERAALRDVRHSPIIRGAKRVFHRMREGR